jgi:hypothetical protein
VFVEKSTQFSHRAPNWDNSNVTENLMCMEPLPIDCVSVLDEPGRKNGEQFVELEKFLRQLI